MSLQSIARDLRALGPAAPVRAAYEASKRLGTHRVVFSGLARRPVPNISVEPALRLPREVPDGARERALSATEEILAGRVTLFSQPVELGFPPESNRTVESSRAWPDEPWWKLDIRGAARIGDVKWTWELGRCRHLVVLARAAALEPGLAQPADAAIQAWASANPPEHGINWYSNLEVALRSIALTEAWSRIDRRLSRRTEELVRAQLWHAGRHLVGDLPYTLSTMRNNHLLGDSLGLQVIGTDFGERRAARAWNRLGEGIFERQAVHHFNEDGSMLEDSLSYHRFVLEMLVIHALLHAPGEAHPALVPSARFLGRLGALDGPVPQYGDWDEGRVLTSTQSSFSVKGSVRAALAVAGSGAPSEWRELHDECAWYAPDGEPADADRAEGDGHDVGGGIARARRGRFTAWLKAGSAESHGHADLCSTPLLYDDGWVVGDPGTGTYNGPIEQRNYFRSSIAHSVLRLEGRDQLEAHRAFRWVNTATGLVGAPILMGDAVVMWGAHDAFRRLDPRRRVARTVVITSDQVTVADWVDGTLGARFDLSLPLGPGVRFERTAGVLSLPGGRQLGVRLPGEARAISGQQEPFDGWWSVTYGAIEPSVRLALSGRVEGPVVWAIASSAASPSVTVEQDRLVASGLSIQIHWGPDFARLQAEMIDGGSVARSHVRWRR